MPAISMAIRKYFIRLRFDPRHFGAACGPVFAIAARPLAMSFESVRAWLADHAPDLRLIEAHASTATVADAADDARRRARPDRQDADRARRRRDLPPRRARRRPARQPEVQGGIRRAGRACSDAEETLALTGHIVGGVCPFGLATPLPVYLDVSLRDFPIVYPAGGSRNASVEVAPAAAVRAGRQTLGRRLPPAGTETRPRAPTSATLSL